MRRIAAPMIGGMVSSTLLTLIVIPAIYALVKTAGILRRGEALTALGSNAVARERPGPVS
jgi:Cu(I)/Ag(I) efflux system membrane protein CusA/SilA